MSLNTAGICDNFFPSKRVAAEERAGARGKGSNYISPNLIKAAGLFLCHKSQEWAIHKIFCETYEILHTSELKKSTTLIPEELKMI